MNNEDKEIFDKEERKIEDELRELRALKAEILSVNKDNKEIPAEPEILDMGPTEKVKKIGALNQLRKNSAGFAQGFFLTLLAGFASGILFMLIYIVISMSGITFNI